MIIKFCDSIGIAKVNNSSYQYALLSMLREFRIFECKQYSSSGCIIRYNFYRISFVKNILEGYHDETVIKYFLAFR